MFTEALQSYFYYLGSAYAVPYFYARHNMLEASKASCTTFMSKAHALHLAPPDVERETSCAGIIRSLCDFSDASLTRVHFHASIRQFDYFELGKAITRYYMRVHHASDDSIFDSLKNFKPAVNRSLEPFNIDNQQKESVFDMLEKSNKNTLDVVLNKICLCLSRDNHHQTIKRSEIDPSRPILDDSWVVSLVRKPDGAHAQHAFLVLEGKQANCAKIWFMDFRGSPVLPDIGDGKIVIHPYKGTLEEELLFCCNRRMMDIRKGDRLLSMSWNISSDKGKQLIDAITQAQRKPPKFNILGQPSLFAIGTGASSSTEAGHNCFTWAKEQLRNLNESHIQSQLTMNDIQSWVFSATSRLLVDYQQQATFWYQRPVAIATMVVLLLRLVGWLWLTQRRYQLHVSFSN